MKKYFLILMLPVFCSAQIPKNANTIIIPGVQFYDLANKMLDENFIIEKKDTDLHTIQTARQPLDKSIYSWTVYIRFKSDTAIIYATGGFQDHHFMGLYFEDSRLAYIGEKKGLPKRGLDKLNVFAQSFGKPVTYETQ